MPAIVSLQSLGRAGMACAQAQVTASHYLRRLVDDAGGDVASLLRMIGQDPGEWVEVDVEGKEVDRDLQGV